MREHIQRKANSFKATNEIVLKGEIVVFGSTYTANFPFYELVNKYKLENAVYNRSIEDLTLEEGYELLKDCVFAVQPKKIFLAFSERDASASFAFPLYEKIVRKIRAELPSATLYLICLPEDSKEFHKKIQSLCNEKKAVSILLANDAPSQQNLYKIQFKQLACFFRTNAIDFSEAFLMANR